MITRYTIEEIEAMRAYQIKRRDECLGEKFDSEGAVTLSHTIGLLYEVLQEQKARMSLLRRDNIVGAAMMLFSRDRRSETT